MTELVADSQVVKRPGAAFFCGFFEPLCSLVVIMKIVVENYTDGVHGGYVALSLRLLIPSVGVLDVLVYYSKALLVDLTQLVECFAATCFVLDRLKVKLERK